MTFLQLSTENRIGFDKENTEDVVIIILIIIIIMIRADVDDLIRKRRHTSLNEKNVIELTLTM